MCTVKNSRTRQWLLQHMQVSQNSSINDSVAIESFSHTVAVYNGQKVAVYIVDKTEITLTRGDLVELVNVCSHLFINVLYLTYSNRHRCL